MNAKIKTPFFTDEEWYMLQDEIANGYVGVNKHPEADIYIYNYTHKTQYDWHWNSITIRCRGLILDGDGCLVAKGFDKFFTDAQLKSAGDEHLIPTDEPFTISDKVDGSLGVMYFLNDVHYMATRGSFTSDMAVTANKWLRDMYSHIVFYPQYSYMFEIVYPENRIVVDYGKDRKLVLLAIMDNNTLEEMDIYDPEFDYIETQGLERTERFDGYADWTKILALYENDKSKEGFVVHFLNSNYRVKMKLDWYKDASYVLQNFTKKAVWRLVRDGKDVEDIISNIDDEFYPLIRGYYDELWVEHNSVLKRVTAVFTAHIEWMDHVPDFTIKHFVVELKKYVTDPFTVGLVISLYKGNDTFISIWRSIEPIGSYND